MTKIIVSEHPDAPREFRWTAMPFEYNGPPDHVATGTTRQQAIEDFIWWHANSDEEEARIRQTLEIVEFPK